LNEWSFFIFVVGIAVSVISYLANKILDRPLKSFIWDWIDAFFS